MSVKIKSKEDVGTANPSENIAEDELRLCGIVMPIAAMGDYLESHWVDVQNIIKEAVELAGYKARLVSESPDATVIIRSIVQNIYKDEIVICDVSGMNPNVMFELGMRLAFDKPVLIIKDDATRFSFDISTIEHLEYPRSLRYQSIQEFKKKLADKLMATVYAANQDEYNTFLSNFGSFKVANLEEITLNESEALEKILTKLDKFDSRLQHLEYGKDDSPYPLIMNNFLHENSYNLLKIEVNSDFEYTTYQKLVDTLKVIYGDKVKVTMVTGRDSKGDKARFLKVSTSSQPTRLFAKQVDQVIHSLLRGEDPLMDNNNDNS